MASGNVIGADAIASRFVSYAMIPPTRKVCKEIDMARRRRQLRQSAKLANGSVITNENIDCLCREFEDESWTGRLERIHVGSAAVTDELLVLVTVKVPKSMVAAIDSKGKSRSDFICKAVAAAL